MWKQLALAMLAFPAAPASASPWYAEVAYAGERTGNAAVGYQFQPWLALEAGYRRSEDGKHAGWGTPHRLDDSDGFEVSMRTAIEVTPRFALTGRLGVYDWNGEDFALAVDDGEASLYSFKRDGVSPIIGAGLRVTLNENFALIGEYTTSEAFEDTSGPSHMLSAGLHVAF